MKFKPLTINESALIHGIILVFFSSFLAAKFSLFPGWGTNEKV